MDELTLHKIQEGDQQAFGLLVNQFKDQVFGLCLKIIQNREIAEETAQDIFVKIFLSINSFKGDSKLSTWIYRIAYNMAISATRKKQLKTTVLNNHSENGVNSTSKAIDLSDKQTQLNEAISQLHPNERGIVNMYYLQELSMKEIHEITGMTISNIKVSLHRARKNLKSILEKQLKNETAWIS